MNPLLEEHTAPARRRDAQGLLDERDGPLVPFGLAFQEELAGAGHPPKSLKHYLLLMGQLNRWLETERLEPQHLCVLTGQQFLDSRRAAGQLRVPTMRSLAPLLDFLRRQGVVPPEPPIELTAAESLLSDYRHHLVHDRGLVPTTVRRYMDFARRFLADRASRTTLRPEPRVSMPAR